MKVSVTVKAGSSQNKVVEADGGAIKGGAATSGDSAATNSGGDSVIVYTSKRAHDGEANAAVIKMLAEYYHVSKSQVSIVNGEKSKHKIVEICL